jgi:DNA-binding response OmpR family regulator
MPLPWFQRLVGNPSPNSPRAQREILVVDDQPEVRAVLQDMLERLGWTVRTAGGPDEALKILAERAEEVGLALIDVMMPECDGVSLALRLRQIHPRLAIVMLSGMLKEETRWVISEQGFRFLPKPFAFSEVGAVVAEAMGDARSGDSRG